MYGVLNMDKILITQQAARLKKIKAAVAKVKAEKQRRVRERIEELKQCNNT